MPTPPVSSVHRTAWFAIHHPTRHVQAVLERAFRDYTDAYTELLFVAARFDLDALRGMAAYALDARTGAPRMNGRTLSQRLFTRPDLPPRVAAMLSRLPSRLRQSVKMHVGQTLMSYVALADAALQEQQKHQERGEDEQRTQGRPKPSLSLSLPSFPSRTRRGYTDIERRRALLELEDLGDDLRQERTLAAALQRTRLPSVIPIPFVGVNHAYGCGLYYQAENRTFYARLDVVSPRSRVARPISLRGCYTDIKTGIRYSAEQHRTPEDVTAGVESFGRRNDSLLVPLVLDRGFHEQTLRFTEAVFLPQRSAYSNDGGRRPSAADPVSAKLVRKVIDGEVMYSLHVSFAVPLGVAAQERAQLSYQDRTRLDAQRPLLAINRGIYHLYSAVVTSSDGREIMAELVADGQELLRVQQAIERARRIHQEHGVSQMPGRDRRARRMATQQVAIAANQIAEVGAQLGAQVVIEDLQSFVRGRRVAQQQPQQPHTESAAYSASSGNAAGVTGMSSRRAHALHAMLNRRQFEALHQAIDSRLDLLGLPRCHVVSAAYISQTCVQCGARDARNAHNPTDLRTFTCVNCGYHADIDQVAAHNVARKLIWLRLRSAEKAADVAESERTPWEVFAREFALARQTTAKQTPGAGSTVPTKRANKKARGTGEGGERRTATEIADGEAS